MLQPLDVHGIEHDLREQIEAATSSKSPLTIPEAQPPHSAVSLFGLARERRANQTEDLSS